MKDIAQSRLATTLALLVGIWVAVSPAWITMSASAQMSTLILGIVMIVFSIAQYFIKSSIPSWVNGVAAILLFLSVFVYGMSTGAIWSATLAAIAVFILSIWDGFEVEHFAGRHVTT